jgi:hypothetical protein
MNTGAFFGGLFGFMMKNQPAPPPGVIAPPQPVAMVGGPLFLGRNVAIMTGMNAGLSILIKRLRGDVEDWKNGCASRHSAPPPHTRCIYYTLVSRSNNTSI